MDMLEKLLSKLVSFKTVSSDHKENQKAINWIKSEVQGLPVYIKSIVIDGFPNLLITTKQTKKPKLWLQAHIDIVYGPAELFKAKRIGNKFYGRGVFDMKFAVVCYIKLLKELKMSLSRYNLGVMITTDEEVGGKNGVGGLIKRGFKSEVCFLPDGGNDFSLEKSAKGIYQIKVSAFGKAGHGAKPWAGVNAIELLFGFINRLKTHFPKEPCKDPKHYHNSMGVGKIIGGDSTNKIPDYAEAYLDIRFVSHKAKKGIELFIKNLIKRSKGIKVKVVNTTPAYEADIENKYHKLFQQILVSRIGRVRMTRSHGTCDARYFVPSGIATIVLRPKGGGHHSDNEWIDLDSLERFYSILKEFVLVVGKIKRFS